MLFVKDILQKISGGKIWGLAPFSQKDSDLVFEHLEETVRAGIYCAAAAFRQTQCDLSRAQPGGQRRVVCQDSQVT